MHILGVKWEESLEKAGGSHLESLGSHSRKRDKTQPLVHMLEQEIAMVKIVPRRLNLTCKCTVNWRDVFVSYYPVMPYNKHPPISMASNSISFSHVSVCGHWGHSGDLARVVPGIVSVFSNLTLGPKLKGLQLPGACSPHNGSWDHMMGVWGGGQNMQYLLWPLLLPICRASIGFIRHLTVTVTVTGPWLTGQWVGEGYSPQEEEQWILTGSIQSVSGRQTWRLKTSYFLRSSFMSDSSF